MMNTIKEIYQKYHAGEISNAEVWKLLRELNKPVPSQPEIAKVKAESSLPLEKLNETELEIIERLQHIRMGYADPAKKFITQIEHATKLTPRQREYLRSILWKYRGQLFTRKQKDVTAKSYLQKMANDIIK